MKRSANKGYILGIDVGGHRVKAGLLHVKTRSIEDMSIKVYPCVAMDPSIDKCLVDTSERIAYVTEMLDSFYFKHKSKIRGIGLSSTDIIDTGIGQVIRSTSPSYQGVNWPKIIREHTSIPSNTDIYIQNDAKCGAWAEYNATPAELFQSRDKAKGSFIRVTVGSGVGSGVIVNGKLIEGAGFVAGEIAYIPYRPHDGFACEYGSGCVEKHASASGILRTAKIALKGSKADQPNADENREFDLSNIQEGLLSSLPWALSAIKDASNALGTALVVIINFLGPDIVSIGGGVIDQIPEYFQLAKTFAYDSCLPPAISKCQIIRSGMPDSEAVIRGVADLALSYAKPLDFYFKN